MFPMFSMFIALGQSTEEIGDRISLAFSIFDCLQSCLWSRRKISLRTNGRVYLAVVRLILLYDCKMWPVRVADENMPTHSISAEIVYQLWKCGTAFLWPLHWDSHPRKALSLLSHSETSWRWSDQEPSFFPPLRNIHKRTGGQVKLKDGLEYLFRARLFGCPW